MENPLDLLPTLEQVDILSSCHLANLVTVWQRVSTMYFIKLADLSRHECPDMRCGATSKGIKVIATF